MKLVTILCTSRKTAYRSLPCVEVYDQLRDARTWAGGNPMVGHPPCRAWSAYTRHQAKPPPGEKELGPFCVQLLKTYGGVLEHPAHSRLWDFCHLPKPSWTHRGDLWSMEVCQAWWGYPMLKKTWLLFSGISPRDVHLPLVLHPHGRDRRIFQVMSKNQRAATTPAFAAWLVETARKTTRS